ncbi:MAG: AAC(3) family N-acetyltransferase [Lentisphaeria bacterium]|nr:AAC(3) family N-acetyltransferase [Lentisphaeria bacterium]
MEELFYKIRNQINADDLVNKIAVLCKIEQGQTFRHYHQAADHVYRLLCDAGIPNVEKLAFPADGKTVYEDHRMPLAWEATIGKLTLCNNAHTVAADFQKHPFHLIKGSTATEPGGEIVRIITEQQFLAGESPENALVMLETDTCPEARVLTPVLDQGGRGIITDFLPGRYDDPDALPWVSSCTEGTHCHVQREDRDFIGFTVNLRMGSLIRQQATHGKLTAEIECDGRRYEGVLPVVTALIPGRREEEVWLMAHLFEPLPDHNSTGVIAGIEVARQIMKMGVPEYSLRLIFTMKQCGYAAFHNQFRGKVIGGSNIDSLPSGKDDICRMIPPISVVPFHGINIMKRMTEELKDILSCVPDKPACPDDMAFSDSTTCIPTVWFRRGVDKNKSAPSCSPDPDTAAAYTALETLWFAETLFYTGTPAELPALEFKTVSSPWRDHAKQQVFARAQTGFPRDLCRVPKAERIRLPDHVIYGPMASLLARMDGAKNMAQIIQETEADLQVTLSDFQIRKYLNAINYLAAWGYLTVIRRNVLTREMLAAALAELGVKRGDVLLVHSAVSKWGYVDGGAQTIIHAVMDVVGPDGAAMFPAFTMPYIYLGESLNRGWGYRPFDSADPSQIWTGAVPRTLLEKFPAAKRSKHVTHSWGGLGAKAAECLAEHGPYDPPTSLNSPIGKALEKNGKVLYLGNGLASSTFLHFIETVNHAPYLLPGVCRVKNPDGTLRTVLIEEHLPGHRDFYREDAENCKFYRRAVQEGLKIEEVAFGMGKIQLIELREFYDISMKLWKEDPRILLCDDPACQFCRRY